jgi:Ca-activated chloride channel homolog
VSIFGRMPDSNGAPEELRIFGFVGKRPLQWVITVVEVRSQTAAEPVLWAREMIRDLEEGTTGLQSGGSRQKAGEESGVKEKIIGISKEFGVVSRETSFLAVEEREDKDKTNEAVVQRMVPVLLTKDWGGIKSYGHLSLSNVNSSCFSEPPHHHLCSPAFDICEAQSFDCEAPMNEKYFVPHESFDLTQTSGCPVLEILSRQRAEGGFDMNAKIARILNTTLSKLKDMSRNMAANGKCNKFLILSTALVMAFLKCKFLNRKDEWETVARKSEQWLQKELKRVQPTIEGISPEEWAKQYIEKQNLEPLEI